MANKYGAAALMASQAGANLDPKARWQKAMESLYPTSPTARKKGSPRGAFLGLCEEGLVKGIPAGHYSASREDKVYAVRAAALLSEETQRWSTTGLWQAVTNDPEKLHSSQMDVVMALWKNDLIVRKI
jgi:hypothetical protein